MAEPDAAGERASKKSSFMATLIEWLVVTLHRRRRGLALTAMNPPAPTETIAKDKPPSGKLSSEAKDGDKATTTIACAGDGPSLVDLPPIVTNIATPADTWVRLEASIVFEPKALAHPDMLAAEIATDELAYLRTLSVAQLEGPIGLENIRQDLRDRALVRSQRQSHRTDPENPGAAMRRIALAAAVLVAFPAAAPRADRRSRRAAAQRRRLGDRARAANRRDPDRAVGRARACSSW